MWRSTAVVVALRTDQSFNVVVLGDVKGYAANLLALAPLAWLMAQIYRRRWLVGGAALRSAALHDADGVSPLR